MRHETAFEVKLNSDGAIAPATVEDFISSTVLKELWTAELARRSCSPCESTFDFNVAKSFVDRVSHRLCIDVLDAVRGWIEIADDLSPDSLLPDLGEFPAAVTEEDGLTVVQRKVLLEALNLIFDVFNEKQPSVNLGHENSPALPPSRIACISMQIASMFELMSLTRPRSAQALLTQGEIELNALQHVSANAGTKPRVGSKAELIQELQVCRNRMFQLEREMESQAKHSDIKDGRDKREAEKEKHSLRLINEALEKKLKDRTEDLRIAGNEITDLQRRVDHLTSQLDERLSKIKTLEDGLARAGRMQADILQRERMYGERMLQLQVQEFTNVCRDNQRKRSMANAIKCRRTEEVESHAEEAAKQEIEMKDLEELANESLARIKSEFESFFVEREKRMMELAQQCEESIAKDTQLNLDGTLDNMNVHESVRKSLTASLYRRWSATGVAPSDVVDASVQTDAIPSERRRADADGGEQRGPFSSEMFRNTGTSADLKRGTRQSLIISQPLRPSVLKHANFSIGVMETAFGNADSIFRATVSQPRERGDQDTHGKKKMSVTLNCSQKVSKTASMLSKMSIQEGSQTPSDDGSKSEDDLPGHTGVDQQEKTEEQASDPNDISDSGSSVGDSRDVRSGQLAEEAAIDDLQADVDVDIEVGNAQVEGDIGDNDLDDDLVKDPTMNETMLPHPPTGPPPRSKNGEKRMLPTLPRPGAKHGSEAFRPRSSTPSTRASSRMDSASASRSNTPFPADAQEQSRSRQSMQLPLRPKTIARTVLTFDRSAR